MGPAKVPGSEGASPPSDPLSDLLSSSKDETGGSSYETEQELERLLVNPVHSMDNAHNFNVGAPLTIPAPSSSAPPAVPGLWGLTPSQDTSNIHTPLGTIPGLPANLGPNPDTGSFPTPPTTSLSARGSVQTEQNSLHASAPGQPHYVATNQASQPFNLGGSLNTNSTSLPVVPNHYGPISHPTVTSMAIPQPVTHSESASLAVPVPSGPQALYYGRNSGFNVPTLPLTNTNLASVQQVHWAKVNGVYTQIPFPQHPISLPFCPPTGPTTISTNVHPFTGGQPPLMTYSIVNPAHHAQGPSVSLSLATASVPSVAPTTTTSLPVLSAPPTICNPSVGAPEFYPPPEPQTPFYSS